MGEGLEIGKKSCTIRVAQMRFFWRRAAVLYPRCLWQERFPVRRVASMEVENIAHTLFWVGGGGLTSQGFKNFRPWELLRPEPRVNFVLESEPMSRGEKKQRQSRKRGGNVKYRAEGLFGFQRFSRRFLSGRLHVKREPYVSVGEGITLF